MYRLLGLLKQFARSSGINGAGLGILTPSVQSIITVSTADKQLVLFLQHLLTKCSYLAQNVLLTQTNCIIFFFHWYTDFGFIKFWCLFGLENV